MSKHCGNCAVYDRKNMKHSELCGKCVTEHFPNGKESDPSMWKPLPQTNADRIRAMSDEELAKILNAFTAYLKRAIEAVKILAVRIASCMSCVPCSMDKL